MVRDLDFGIELRFGPTRRDPDGLAMSSRNAYLSPAERSEALLLHEALGAGRAVLDAGERDVAPVTARVRAVLGRGRLLQVEYVELVDIETLEPCERVEGDVLLAVAARVGGTRLIDNLMLRVTTSDVQDQRREATIG
jgi:pantoate--beta-alanine ligase